MDDKTTTTSPPSDLLEIQAAQYDSLYEQLVKPDRALYLPGYFKRWLKYLGPDLAWMYASFRQAAYLDGGRNGSVTSRFTVAEIAARAGITERTFWNRAANATTWEKLAGLITRVEEDAKWDISSGTPKQLPRKFTIAMTLPLTPRDAVSLKHWLTANVEKYGGAEGVLRAAASAAVHELIPLNIEHTETHAAVTVRQLVYQLFGAQLNSKLLDALASAIQNNLMPSNDQIKITLYFMEHVLPYLGSGAGWVVTLLRDLCFDGEHETRNQAVVRGGYDEIAAWLGLQGSRRARTIWDWLNEKYPASHAESGKYKYPLCRLYLREEAKEERERDFEKQTRVFSVLLEELPHELLEAHLTRRGALAQILNGAVFKDVMTRFSVSVDALFSLGMTHFSVSDDALFSLVMTHFSDHIDATFRVKALKPLNQTLKTPPTQPAGIVEKAPEPTPVDGVESKPASAPEQSAPVVGRVGWDFSQIAQNNSVNARSAKELRKFFADEQIMAQKFLAWILYAYSPLGKGLTDTTGVSKAIKSLCNTQPEFAPQKFERLAKLGFAKLRELFDRDYAREELGKSAESNIYRANFKKLDPARKSELYFALFGVDCPEPAATPKATPQKTVFQIRMEQVKARKAQQATAP